MKQVPQICTPWWCRSWLRFFDKREGQQVLVVEKSDNEINNCSRGGMYSSCPIANDTLCQQFYSLNSHLENMHQHGSSWPGGLLQLMRRHSQHKRSKSLEQLPLQTR